jgi:hypothetical protein
MKDNNDMTGSAIIPPLILFLDDGVNVFGSVIETESHLEAIDVQNHPEWQGFDSKSRGLRLEVIGRVRKVLGISLNEDRVGLRVDPSLSLDAVSDVAKDQMRDYLLRVKPEGDEKGLTHLSASEMLAQILKTASGDK